MAFKLHIFLASEIRTFDSGAPGVLDTVASETGQFTAFVKGENIDKVEFTLPDGGVRTEGYAPYTLYGDNKITDPPPGAVIVVDGGVQFRLKTAALGDGKYEIGAKVFFADGSDEQTSVRVNVGEANWEGAGAPPPDPEPDPAPDETAVEDIDGKWFLLARPKAYDLVMMERYGPFSGLDPARSDEFAARFKALVDEFWIDATG